MATECFHLFRFVTLMSKHVRDLECIMVKGVSFSRFDYYIITDVYQMFCGCIYTTCELLLC